MATNSQPVVSQKSSLAWADRVRILATLMMIIVHISGPIAERFPDYNSVWWWTANLWDSISRPCVPLFVMLSGYLLFSKTYSTADFFKKRFSRVLIPAITWAVIYLVYTHFWDGSPATFGEAGRMLIEGPVHYHLWFIYLIIGLYASYPFIAPWVRQARDTDFWLLFGICGFGVFFFKMGKELFGFEMGFLLDFFSNQLIYFVAGYYFGQKMRADEALEIRNSEFGLQNLSGQTNIQNWKISRRQIGWLSLGLIVFGTGATALGTYFMGRETGVFHPWFYDYLTPHIFVGTVGWFLLFRHFLNESPLFELEIDFAKGSYGIYLCHVLVLYALNFDLIYHSRFHPLLDIPLTGFLCAFEAFLLIWLIQKLPSSVSKWFA